MIYIIFLLSNFFFGFNCDYDFFVVKKYGDPNYYCVTSSSYALSWISNRKNESDETKAQVSSFIPKTNQINFFDWDISENDEKTKMLLQNNRKWSSIKSLNSELNDVILDRRWEDMKMYETGPDRQSVLILNNLKNDSVIPISIRTEGDAKIFLCNGPSIIAECYEFRLQYWDIKQKSAIIKHIKTKPYSHTIKVKNHSSTLLFFSQWIHFKLTRSNEFLSLEQKNNEDNSFYLQLTEDKSGPINVSHMIIHSGKDAFWKIHELDFIYTEKSNEILKLDSIIDVRDGLVCVSMFIWMCDGCELNLKLHSPQKDQFYTIGDQQYKQEGDGWMEIKFIEKNIEVDQVVLRVITSPRNGSVFWAIDKIRLCQKEEYRMIQTDVQSKCILLTNETNYVISLEKSSHNEDKDLIPPLAEMKCPQESISGLCVPCTWLPFENCRQIKICKTNKTQVTCFCSVGYKYGDECINECDIGTFGHNCTQKCGKCIGGRCNNDDGKCPKCIENYSGEKCDIPPELTFAEAPKIKNISYTEVTIQMINFTIINENFEDRPSSYVIEYKKKFNSDEWLKVNKEFKLNKTTPIKINNLETGTEYIVKAIVVTVNKYEHVKGPVKTLNFTTKCDDLTKESFQTVPSNTSVGIMINITNQTCKIKNGRINLLYKENPQFNNRFAEIGSNTSIFFEQLTPYTEYQIVIVINSKQYTKTVQTTEGVPGQIRNLTITNLSAKSVTLNWESPLAMNGKLKHYKLEYEHLSYKSCGLNSILEPHKKSNTTKNNSLTIDNLIPYSNYLFSVYASNDRFEGPPYTLNCSTPTLDLIQNEEMPQLINSPEGVRNVNLIFSKINCIKLKGALLLKISAKCSNEWCKNKTSVNSFYYNPTTTEVSLSNLFPFSKYNLTIQFCRNETFCSDFVINKPIQTDATVPTQVSDLLVYSKDEKSASVRWKSPYPPTGELAEYLIKYHFLNSKEKEISLKTSDTFPCKLWPDFHCYKISNLTSNQKYKLMIQARNQNPPEYGQPKKLEFETKKEKSEASYDLTIEWALNNDLILRWKHPSVTNGDIQLFNISVFESNTLKTKKELKVNENNYTFEYEFKVEATVFQPSTLYSIEISAYNGYNGNSIKKTDRSPPAIPSLLNSDPKFSSTDNTIHLEISLNKTKILQNNNYMLFLLISGKNTNFEQLHPRLEKLAKVSNLINFTLILECNLLNLNSSHSFTIGDGVEVGNCNSNMKNIKLIPATLYNVTILFANHFGDKTSYKIYSFNYQTEDNTLKSQQQTNLSLLPLLLLLLLIPLALVFYIKRQDLITQYHSLRRNLLREDNTDNEEEIPLQDQNEKIKVYSKKIKISDFEQYVKESIKNGELERQHALFPRGQTMPWTCGDLKENKSKNRYTNLKAYDHSRVVLEKIDGNEFSDYINANYINGYEVPKAYIATQGPKASTVNDFWRMIWQENVQYIIMLANVYEGGKKKVEQYWPQINETLIFGNVTVINLAVQVFANYEYRQLKITCNSESRKVDQIHFSSWPDHGVPLYSQSLVPFLKRLLKIPLNSKNPIVIHCSAGVGRTGTILLCDICLRMAAKKGVVDLLRTLQKLRQQRPNMVDNIQQYKLAHLVILESLNGMQTGISCNEVDKYVKNLLENDGIKEQMQYLEETSWQDEAMKETGQHDKTLIIIKAKNRIQSIIPEIQGCLYISRYPSDDETSYYINAVTVDGFKSPGRFIVTQQPLPNTISDFWRLVNEHDVSVIISLNEINLEHKVDCLYFHMNYLDTSYFQSSCNFWPTEDNQQIKPVDYMTLEYSNTLSNELYDSITIHMSLDDEEEYKIINIISLKNWSSDMSCPNDVSNFLTFWEDSYVASRKSERVIVTCYNGATASGLYVTLSFIIEKIKLEQICDVCQAVRAVRHNRGQFVRNEEQFIFLYRSAVEYINRFHLYANFQ